MKGKDPIKVTFRKELFNEVYVPTYRNKDRFLFLYGGAGSGKSEWAAQKILIRMLEEKQHRFLMTRKVAKTIRNSQFLLFKDIVSRWGLNHLFEFHSGELSIKCENGNEIISTGMDDPEKLKSITSISGIWAEELTEYTQEDMRQLNIRMRGNRVNYKQFIGSFNPTDIEHWIRKQYFPAGDSESNIHTFEIVDKHSEFQKLYGTALRTTFRDNKFIDDADRAVLAALEEEDENYFRIYAQGLWGVRSKGLIYRKWQIVEAMPLNPDYECYGLDFGFTNPTALVRVAIKGGEVFTEQVIYQKNLTNPELINELRTLGIGRRLEIFADSAEPDRIQEIYDAGFNIHAANKNVSHGIEIVQNLLLNIASYSEDMLKEIKRYIIKLDKNGNSLNEPVKMWDHSMDALRYAIYTAWLKYGDRVFGGKSQQKYAPKARKERASKASDYDKY